MKRNLRNTEENIRVHQLTSPDLEQNTGKETVLLWRLVYDLVVMGTSARPLSSTAGARRTKATTGRSRNSNSPTRTLEASAPGGIFFMKWRSICTREITLRL